MMSKQQNTAKTLLIEHGPSDDLLAHASSLDPLTFTQRDARRLSRQVRSIPGEKDVRIAFVGNVVLEPLAEFVEAHLLCSGLVASTYVAPFGRAIQEILDSTSDLRTFSAHFLLLHLEADTLMPFSHDSCETLNQRSRAELDELFSRVESVVRSALDNTAATVLVTNFVEPDSYALGLADFRCELSEQEQFFLLNLMLTKAFRSEPRVQIVDLRRLTAAYGLSRARDRRLYYVAKLPWHEKFMPLLSDELVRHVTVGLGRIRKCLVVDLDNSLWGGVLGEDGPLGVRVGQGDPVAEAHFDLQRRILAIKQRGILLAICSKNNCSDVDEIFRIRKDMPLRQNDFVCIEASWDMKHEGLRRIATQLNIGTDSLVFLDDNPAEIDLIHQLMPEVQCVLVPTDPALRPMCLDGVHGLERVLLTAEDLEKTRQYQQNAERDATLHKFSSVSEYLDSLKTHITICSVNSELLPRAHQLFSKTNQFNVTTRRYSLAELQKFLGDSGSRLIVVRVEDRFGDIGWAGAVLLRGLDETEAYIDSFILSCRAMGRGVESAVLNWIKSWCFENTRCRALTAEYVPTAKNTPVVDFYEKHGFTVVSTSSDGAKYFSVYRDDKKLTPCGWISLDYSD